MAELGRSPSMVSREIRRNRHPGNGRHRPMPPRPARTPVGRAPSSGGSDRTLICGSFILRILAALHKNQATSAKATRWRVATTAAPTSAAVKRMCGSHICVATAYQGTRYVQDITVFTRDGLPGTLRAFASSYRQSRANDDRHVFIVNQEIGEPGSG